MTLPVIFPKELVKKFAEANEETRISIKITLKNSPLFILDLNKFRFKLFSVFVNITSTTNLNRFLL